MQVCPFDPESPHKAAGCRIGGRLDFVEQQNKAFREMLEEMKEVFFTCPFPTRLKQELRKFPHY